MRWHLVWTWVLQHGNPFYLFTCVCGSTFTGWLTITLLPRRTLFPDGLPPSYVFVATMRYKGSVAVEEWDLWRVQTRDGRPQMAVSLNGLDRTIMFTTTSNSASGTQTVTFSQQTSRVKCFLSNWPMKCCVLWFEHFQSEKRFCHLGTCPHQWSRVLTHSNRWWKLFVQERSLKWLNVDWKKMSLSNLEQNLQKVQKQGTFYSNQTKVSFHTVWKIEFVMLLIDSFCKNRKILKATGLVKLMTKSFL